MAAGDLAAARAAYQASLDIRARLAAADPANTEWQRDLSVSHDKLGDVAVAAGDLAAARDHYQASLDIAHRLAAADPANTEWQRDLSISHEQARGRRRGGRGPGRRPRRLPGQPRHRRPASRRRPRQRPWQRDLSISHEKLGDIAIAAGDLATARDHHRASLDIAGHAGRRRPRQRRMATRPGVRTAENQRPHQLITAAQLMRYESASLAPAVYANG